VQFFLVSVTLPLVVIAGLYLLFSFSHKIQDWRAVQKRQPAEEKTLTVEIDKEGT
jgi:hypothetical protein